VGHAAEDVGREIGKVGEAAAQDPIGTIAKVAAIATQQYWALPLISAATVIAHGGDIGQAALAAGISYAGGAIAAGVGDYLGAGATGVVDMMSADAVELANQGLTGTQIADILQQSYSVSSDIAAQTAAQAAIGQTAAEIAKDIGGQMATQNMLAGVAGNTVGGMARTALGGGDINQILMSGVTTGAGSLAGGVTSTQLKELGINGTVANALGKATGAATASTIGNKDAKLSFINSLINTTLTESGKQVSSTLKTAWNSVTDNAVKYNEQLKTAQETFEKSVTPLQAEAKELQAAAKESYDEYKPVSDKYQDLLAQFNEAKNANNIELANSLVGQLNALAPELNAAATKYNDAVAVFQEKNTEYTSAIDKYKAEIATVDQIKSDYDQSNAQLDKSTEELKNAATEVADMSPVSKKAFEDLYNSGTDATTALDTSKTVNSLSATAQDTFIRNLVTSQDPEKALEIAKTVDGMSTAEQASYINGIRYGLDDATAIETAPNISNLSAPSQKIYLDELRNGSDQYSASITAALSEMFGGGQTTAPNGTAYAPTASTNTTGSVTDVGGGATTPLVPSGNQSINITGVPMYADYATDTNFDKSKLAEGQRLATIEEVQGKKAGAAYDEDLNAWVVTDTKKPFFPDANAEVPNDYQIITPTVPKTGGADTAGGDKVFVPGTPVVEVNPTVPPSPTTPGATGGGGGGGGSGVNSPAGVGETGPSVNQPSDMGGGSGNGTGIGTGNGSGNGPGIGSGTGGGTGSGNGTGTGSGSGPNSGSGTGTGGTGFNINIPGTGSSTTGTKTTGVKTTGTGGYNYNLYGQNSQDTYGNIRNLTPGLTDKLDYTLSGLPNIQENMNPIPQFATGSSVDTTTTSANTYDPFNTGTGNTTGISSSLTPGFTRAKLDYILAGMPGANIVAHAEGGSIEDHNPTFYSEGGLSSMENRYVEGEGDGTSDSVAAMLANGEFVIPADVVSKLGNGSNEAGAGVLDQFLVEIRKHANSNGEKLPPESKGPLGYLLDAKRKVKA
jgi:hypothetical protein